MQDFKNDLKKMISRRKSQIYARKAGVGTILLHSAQPFIINKYFYPQKKLLNSK